MACIGSRLGWHESSQVGPSIVRCRTPLQCDLHVHTCMHQLNAVIYSHSSNTRRVSYGECISVCFMIHVGFIPQHSSINCPLMYRRVCCSMLQVHIHMHVHIYVHVDFFTEVKALSQYISYGYFADVNPVHVCVHTRT